MEPQMRRSFDLNTPETNVALARKEMQLRKEMRLKRIKEKLMQMRMMIKERRQLMRGRISYAARLNIRNSLPPQLIARQHRYHDSPNFLSLVRFKVHKKMLENQRQLGLEQLGLEGIYPLPTRDKAKAPYNSTEDLSFTPGNSGEVRPIETASENETDTKKEFFYSSIPAEKYCWITPDGVDRCKQCHRYSSRAKRRKEKVASLASVVNRLKKVSLSNPQDLDDLSEETIKKLRQCHL